MPDTVENLHPKMVNPPAFDRGSKPPKYHLVYIPLATGHWHQASICGAR